MDYDLAPLTPRVTLIGTNITSTTPTKLPRMVCVWFAYGLNMA